MEEIMENIQEFKTHDFYQAVILKTAQLPLIRLERSTGKFVVFVFNDPEYKAEGIIEKYWAKELTLVAREMIENINELKTRIHSGV